MSYEISGPIVEMFVVQSWNSHNILSLISFVVLCQVTVHQLSNTNYDLALSKIQ